jgi:hypothetical protein
MRSVTDDRIAVLVLKDEIKHLESLLQPHDTGHINTAISVLTHRVLELERKLEEFDGVQTGDTSTFVSA